MHGLWLRLGQWLRRDGRVPDSLLSADAMQDALDRERLCADRAGGTFTVATFQPVISDHWDAVFGELQRVFRQRLRGSDLAGLLPDGRVGVLLSDTPVTGGTVFVDGLRRQWRDTVPFPIVRLYVYPSLETTSEFQHRVHTLAENDEDTVRGVELLLAQPMPWWKRTMDIAGAVTGLVLFAPVFLLAAGAIKVTSRGPVFFRQQRSGRNGRPFWMYKFRSMIADAAPRQDELRAHNAQDGPAFKMENDPRVTAVGRVLRATNLDELPQLWNVLKGEMSLVGPRPLPCAETDQIPGWQRRRLDATPGLTCLWQVQERRNRIPFADWIRLDLRYVKSVSGWLDVRLLLKTLRHLTGRRRSL